MARFAVILLLAVAGLVAPAEAGRFKPGQWTISETPQIQQICIVSDGTWYGTTYNWSGHWMYSTQKPALAVIFGNYGINNQPFGYGNDTLTIRNYHRGLFVVWQDWLDDSSYAFFDNPIFLGWVKKKCDPPYTGANTEPPSYSAEAARFLR